MPNAPSAQCLMPNASLLRRIASVLAAFAGHGLARFGISRSQTTIRCFRIPYFSVQITVLHIFVF